MFAERLRRSFMCEEVHLHDYASAADARQGLGRRFGFYDEVRPHQEHGYRVPTAVYRGPPRLRKNRIGP